MIYIAFIVAALLLLATAVLIKRDSNLARAESAEAQLDALIDAVDDVIAVLQVHGWNTRRHDLITRNTLRGMLAKLERSVNGARP